MTTTYRSSRYETLSSDSCTTSPHTPTTYSLTQPVAYASPNQIADGLGFRVHSDREVDAIPAELKYYEPETEANINTQDGLYFDRTKSVTPATDVDSIRTDNGHVITTTIEVGDVFYPSSLPGLWEYVGIAQLQLPTEVEPEEIFVFEPVTREAKNWVDSEGSRTYPDKRTFNKSDFAHKFSSYPVKPSHGPNGLYIHRVNPDAYTCELTEITLHDDPDLPVLPEFTCTTEETIRQHSPTLNAKPNTKPQSVIEGLIEAQGIFTKHNNRRIPERVPREHQYTHGAFNTTVNTWIL